MLNPVHRVASQSNVQGYKVEPYVVAAMSTPSLRICHAMMMLLYNIRLSGQTRNSG